MIQFVSRAYHASKLALETHAPTIMVVGGVVSMGAGAVIGAKQTLKVEEVLAKHTPALESIKEGQGLFLEGYTHDDARQDRAKVYSRAGFDLVKLYAVPGVLFIGGSALVFGGHRLMLQRNATLAIAFTGLQKAYQAYRANVQETMGHEYDQAMLTGYTSREIVHEDGTTEWINERDWDAVSSDPYNRVFEQGESTQWVPDIGINKFFLQNQQRFAQQLLNNQGHLYLSDVYRALGFAETPMSRVVGWKQVRLSDGSRDIPIVDFGLDKPMNDDWKYSREQAIYLDFNCQGLIVGGMIQKMLEEA